MSTTVKRTAYSYVRFSSRKQEKGDSVGRQIDMSQRYAEQNNMVIDQESFLDDGVSAYKGLNATATKGLGLFLKLIKDGRIKPNSFLLVESFDRLSRETPMDAFSHFKAIVDSGVTIVTLADDRTYSRALLEKDFNSFGIAMNMMTRAHEESLIKSQRVSSAWERKRKNAGVGKKNLTARCPSWLKAKPDNIGFELIPEKVAVVREILEWTSKGMGQSQIVKILNHRKEKPFGKGNGWQSSSIQKILMSPALYGDFHMGRYEKGKKVDSGDVCVGYFPALITKEEFYLIQAGRKQRLEPGGRTKKGETVSNLFSGLLKCGYCGGKMAMVGTSAKRRRNEVGEELPRLGRKAIACQNAIKGLGCWAVQWGYSEFEISFLTFCKDIELAKLVDKLDEDGQPKSAKLELADKRRAVEEELNDLRGQRSKLIDVLAALGASGSDGVLERLSAIEIEIKGKQSLVQQLDIDIVSKDAIAARDISQAKDLKAAIEKVASLPQDQLLLFRLNLSEHIRNLIEKITVYPAGLITPPAENEELRKTLQNILSAADIDLLISLNKTEPLRVGRGAKGRYADKDSGRYFSVNTKNGNFLVITPKKGDAAVAAMYMNKNDGEMLTNTAYSGRGENP